jgi:hypothetical protein
MVMTWRLQLGFIALMRGLEQLNVLELVGELEEKGMEMTVNIVALSESLESLFDAVYQSEVDEDP